jgi:hypothetical protein
MAWFLKYYECDECGERWTDEWSCACNDRCPECRSETEAHDWDDLTVVVEDNGDGTWAVLVSQISAEDSPRYETHLFDRERSANYFARRTYDKLRRKLEESV